MSSLIAAFERNQLLLFASAISFQVFTAIVPVLLLGFGLLGALDLRDVWLEDVRPNLSREVSPAVLDVADETVDQVFDSRQLFWITGGAALAVWQVSGAVRATMDALNRIYSCRETRSRTRRYALSTGLAAAGIVLGLLAVAAVALLPAVLPEPATALKPLLFALRWATAAGLLCLAVGLIVHVAPNLDRPLAYVSTGVLVVVVGWLLMSGALLAYLVTVASYGSLFGNLATIVVLAGYVYSGAVLFLAGLEVDALLRGRRNMAGLTPRATP